MWAFGAGRVREVEGEDFGSIGVRRGGGGVGLRASRLPVGWGWRASEEGSSV